MNRNWKILWIVTRRQVYKTYWKNRYAMQTWSEMQQVSSRLPLYLNDLLHPGNLHRNLPSAVSSCWCRISSAKTTSEILFISSLTGTQKHRLPFLRYRGGSQVSELFSFSPCLLVNGSSYHDYDNGTDQGDSLCL